MKSKGFTIIELLIVVALIGILVSVGGVSIKKQAESRAMLKIQNEFGDFFRVAAKRSLETGKKYSIHFDLTGKEITISRNGEITDTLELPNIFEYEKISASSVSQDITKTLTTNGNMSGGFTLYVFKANSETKNDWIAKYAIRFTTTDTHVKFLHVKEYVPISEVKREKITSDSRSVSNTTYWNIIKEQ